MEVCKVNHQFLVASYRKDFEWLIHNIRSLQKFSVGFLPPAVVVPGSDYVECQRLLKGLPCDIQVKDGPGFGRAQVVMMSGDIHCPKADFVYLTGSDCMAIRRFDYTEYWKRDEATGTDKPIMLWNTWDHLAKHKANCLFWRAGTEHALGGVSAGEFMRRLPIVYPRDLYPRVRGHISNLHGDFEKYVNHHVNTVRNFSESDVMGEFAYRYMRQYYTWICLDNAPYDGAMAMTQFWSRMGVRHPSDRHNGRLPIDVIRETLDKT